MPGCNQGAPETRGLPQPRVQLLPQLLLPGPDGTLEARTDSTPLIRELEQRYAGRSVIPPDGALAFIDALLEDYADEWLTKAMFHYRWAFAPDIANAAAILPRWFRTDQPERDAVANGKHVRRAPDRAPGGRRLEPGHRAGDRGELPAPAALARRASH